MKRLLLTTLACIAPVGYVHAQHMNAHDSPCKDGASTSDLAECLDKALTAADTKLNKTYARVQKVLDPGEINDLKRAQRLWIQFRDATCNAEKSLYSGGTAATPAYLACVEAQTRLREDDLLTTYGWRLEKAGL